jgi:hypothetical protein
VPERYAICPYDRIVRPAEHQSPLAAVAQKMRESEIEPRSIALFLVLLSAFVAILTLRAHLLAPVDSSPVVSAAPTLPSALAAKSSSLRPSF